VIFSRETPVEPEENDCFFPEKFYFQLLKICYGQEKAKFSNFWIYPAVIKTIKIKAIFDHAVSLENNFQQKIKFFNGIQATSV